MASEARAARVAELIREEIGGLLSKGLKDPRIGFVSIMGVKMSRDLRYASVYVSFYGSDKEKKSSLIGLERSAGWVRREIGRRLHLRLTPEIRFFEDTSLDDLYRLDEVFEEIREIDGKGNDE